MNNTQCQMTPELMLLVIEKDTIKNSLMLGSGHNILKHAACEGKLFQDFRVTK